MRRAQRVCTATVVVAAAARVWRRPLSWRAFGGSSDSSSDVSAQRGAQATDVATASTTATATTTTSAAPVDTHEQRALLLQQQLQSHHERIADACLELLDVCVDIENNGNDKSNSACGASVDVVREVVRRLLHDDTRTPHEQFDVVYAALCLPLTRQHDALRRGLMVLLSSCVPHALYRVFDDVDLVVIDDDDADSGDKNNNNDNDNDMHCTSTSSPARRRAVLCRLVHALLGDMDSSSSNDDDHNNTAVAAAAAAAAGVSFDELVAVYVDDVRCAFPQLQHSSAFATLARDAARVAMRAQLLTKLLQLCRAFDTAHTGTVAARELHATAARVLGGGDAAATRLLSGVRADEHGMLCYAQIAQLLTQPPPPPAATATSS